MRGGRSFLILLVLALGVGAYAYFVESKRTPADSAPKHDKVFTADTSKIEQIEVKAASGQVTRLKKSGTSWQVVSPEATDADTNAVSSIVSSLESLQVESVVDDNPKAVSQFGLDPARYSVAFQVTGDAAMHRLSVGSKTANGADVYARVEGQPRVILIGASTDDSLNRTTFDLRDKTVLKFSRDTADGLTLEAPGAPALTFARKGSDWRLTAPAQGKADFSAVDGLVGQIAQAQMKAIVSGEGTSGPPSDADLKKDGLDKPQITATIGTGSARATLAIGGKKDDATLYARDLSRPLVFTVDKALLDSLTKKADDVRAKDIFEFRSFTALNVDITLNKQTYTLTKTKTPAKDANAAPTETWKLTKPSAKDVDQTKVSDLLSDFGNMRADKFSDKPFTTGDEVVVAAKFGDEASPKQERVTFRKSGDVVQAIREGESGAAIVPTADFDKAVNALKDVAGIK